MERTSDFEVRNEDDPPFLAPDAHRQYIKSEIRIWAMTSVLCVGAFLVSMDRTIITVATPSITAHFHMSANIGWLGSAYLITSCASLPLFGRIYDILDDPKPIYLTSSLVFLAGSALCSFAPTALALIAGRAVAGLGTAGMFAGTLIICARAVEPGRRVLLMAVGGLMMSVAAIVGPLIGGALTAGIGWRWCFLINLPIVACLVLAVPFVLRFPARPMMVAAKRNGMFWRARLKSFDVVGAALILVAAVMLFLALQYAADGMSWFSAKTTGLLVGSAATTAVLIFWLKRMRGNALIPLCLLTNPSVTSACIMALGLYGALTAFIYYLPVYFQAAMDMSAQRSAVALLPYLLSTTLTSIAVGASWQRIHLPPRIVVAALSFAGCGIAVIGAGLLTTVGPGTRETVVTGYQIIFGAGLGLAIQQGQNMLQFTLKGEELSVAMTLVLFCQMMGGAVAAAVGNAVFLAVLRKAAPKTPPGIGMEDVIHDGYRAFQALPVDYIASWLAAYGSAIRATFLLIVGLVAVAFFGAGVITFDGWRKQTERACLQKDTHECRGT
ncbi:MFS general substrate transporter [Teratosphaeria destructans]|uniref:MFS general substrate transporter n=1 Tax=Teratosphaeria destructans TaxID=418781 RepID=A0A9W7SS36_9PEZI|nr:MFS general substrate transporter [Teratosphaeria destructans]